MDNNTLTSAAMTTDCHRLQELEQAKIICSLLRKEGAAADAAGVIKDMAKEGMALNIDQLADFSTELLLTVLLLRLLDERAEGRVAVTVPSSASSDEQLEDDAAAGKMKKKRAAAAAKKKEKKKRYKRNKAAAKQKQKQNKTTKLMSWSWIGGGLISMIAFGSIMTLVVPLSLIHQTDGSGEGNAPPALPPSVSKPLRLKDIRSNNDNAASVSSDIINHPLAAVVPPPIFSPSAVTVSNRLMRSDANATFNEIERNALIDFYDSTKGAEWTNTTNWLDEDASYCNWWGVTCDEMGHVTNLTLANNGLSGRLSESIGNLSFIGVLDLSDNDMKGSIPTDIGLPKLRQFDMSSNSLSGSLPESFNKLPQLRQFDMSSNALSGELPDFADSFLSLQELDLSNQMNGFTGSIPEDLSKLQSLKILNLAGNKLAGTIPPAIGNMAVLEVFDLSNNLLESSIPAELGLLAGTLKRLGLANNGLTGMIPSQLGQLQGASVILEGNWFGDSLNAPLSLCTLRNVTEFDLEDNVLLCPVERNALSDLYYSTNGAEWTNDPNWLDEYASYCGWHGVVCDNKEHVKEIHLANNGLSGRLSESIGYFRFIEVLGLSDNGIKGSIPTQIGLLSKLTYLSLSYNAFTGAVPKSLGDLTKLQLLQLQSNRITEIPDIIRLNDAEYGNSTFVTDCGVPAAFDEAPKCVHCTMCCNVNDDCYPQEDIFSELGLNIHTFSAILLACFIACCCVFVLFLYLIDMRKNRGNASTMSNESERLKEDDEYALSRIGKDSVYYYFATDKPIGWLIALTTLGTQFGILAFFLNSAATLYECPRDSDVCTRLEADLTGAGWFIFSVLTIIFLAKDIISGSKLIYLSSRYRFPRKFRIRYFIGGMCLCSITGFTVYVSILYNQEISKSNTDLIVNAVIIHFVMEMDERVFSALAAANEKWTAHAPNSEDTSSDTDAEKGSTIEEIKREIESQQEELKLQQEQMTRQNDEITVLSKAVQTMQESQAVHHPNPFLNVLLKKV